MLIAFSPPMLLWAHHDIRGHMVQHLLLGMLAPLAWVVAAPMTLLLRTVPVNVAGHDASPYHAPFITRLFVLLLGIGAHSYLAKLMYINLWPSGTFSTAEEIRSAAQIMYYGGDLAEALLAVVLFYGWLEKSKRHHTRNIPQAACLSQINERLTY